MEQEEKLCIEVETVRVYISSWSVSGSGGFEAAVTAGTRFEWANLEDVGVSMWKNIFCEAERDCLQQICTDSNSVWK